MVGFKKMLVNMVLAGKIKMAWDFDTEAGEPVGGVYQITTCEAAAFLRPRDAGFARCSISGLLLFGAGLNSVIGVLHPNPVRPFDPSLLPGIEFGEVTVNRETGRIETQWPKPDDV